jgi:GAF domain-containing protein
MAELDRPERLEALQGALLDTAPDAVLDDLVRSAAAAASAPIALISVVMGHVQYFRAHVGLPADLVASRATSRCDSFCQYVVKSEGPFIVTDARQDTRVPQQLVEQYGIRAYLGVPVRLRGEIVGSLCVIDAVTRQFEGGVLVELLRLARRVERRLEELEAAQVAVDVADDPALAALAREARQAERLTAEVAPLTRLAAAAARGELTPEELQRGARVLAEPADASQTMLDSVRRFREAAERLNERIRTNKP